MPKTIAKDISIAFTKAHKIRQEKRKDYGGNLNEYFPFDDESYVHEIFKKSKRLVSLVKKKEDPVFESIEDNLLDLINYASFYYEFLEGK